MSNRKLVLSALALILGVVGSVAWYLCAEAAEQRALREERRPPVAGPEVSEHSTSAVRALGGRRLVYDGELASDCPCRDSARG